MKRPQMYAETCGISWGVAREKQRSNLSLSCGADMISFLRAIPESLCKAYLYLAWLVQVSPSTFSCYTEE